MDEPVVYFKPGCPFGIRLRIALTVHRVAHRAVRFRDDEDGAARVREVNGGNEVSPTVHIAGRWLTNPRWRDVRDRTSIAQGVPHQTGPTPGSWKPLPRPRDAGPAEPGAGWTQER